MAELHFWEWLVTDQTEIKTDCVSALPSQSLHESKQDYYFIVI